jgi:hypothetical protein
MASIVFPKSKFLDDKGMISREWVQWLQNPQFVSLTFVGVLDILSGGTGTGLSPGAGQILIGTGTGYSLSTLTAGGGIAITNGAGSITIALSASGVTPGTYGTASKAVTFHVDANGFVSSASEQNIAITNAQVSGLGTMSTQSASAVAITGGNVAVVSLGNSGARTDTSYSYQTPVTGFSITVGDAVYTLLLEPAGVLATGTIVMPANPTDGQVVRFSTTQNITALTVSPNAGQTVKNAPTSMLVNLTGSQGYEYIYRLANTTWYRLA